MILANGIRVRTDSFGEAIVWAEASLPRLLFGHNGAVLQNQAEIDEALQRLREGVAEVAIMPTVSQVEVLRADIAWNFAVPARPIIIAHAHARVATIRRGPTRFPDDTGISWRGGGSEIVLTLYDKSRKMRIPGSVLRVELSLRKKRLQDRLPNGAWRCFDHLWSVFSEVLNGVTPIHALCEAQDWIHAIAPESPEVRARVLARLAHKSTRTRRRYAQLMANAAAEARLSFSWTNLVGSDVPPQPVNLAPIRVRRRDQSDGPSRTTAGRYPNNQLKGCTQNDKG